MKIIPLSLKAANQFVTEHHRHHTAVQGHKFSLGLMLGGSLIGCVIVGRPVSRVLDDGLTLEVTRLCTDGTTNACSKLYGTAAKVAKVMGYKRIITYILVDECGVSLRASGWTLEADRCGGGEWTCPSRPRAKSKSPTVSKQRWVKQLN